MSTSIWHHLKNNKDLINFKLNISLKCFILNHKMIKEMLKIKSHYNNLSFWVCYFFRLPETQYNVQDFGLCFAIQVLHWCIKYLVILNIYTYITKVYSMILERVSVVMLRKHIGNFIVDLKWKSSDVFITEKKLINTANMSK